jgi:hypothetical protein
VDEVEFLRVDPFVLCVIDHELEVWWHTVFGSVDGFCESWCND